MNTAQLDNPKNDASDMAAALKGLGFHVIEGRDLAKAAMDHKIRDFAEALAGASAALFFYAGHGVQIGGQNYLVPIDARLTSAAGIDFELVRLDLIHRAMEREAPTNIIFLDACRDNPLTRNLARALGTRSTQIGKGLAATESGEGTLISFSTQPGNVAYDGEGRNSPFAKALLKHIVSPGDDLPSILIKVRNDVMKDTGRRQVPWEHSALTAPFYFSPKPAAGAPAPDSALKAQMELSFWNTVKDSNDPGVVRTYLERYPAGTFVPLARALIDLHERQLKAAETKSEAETRTRADEERVRLAALPKLPSPEEAAGPFDGMWSIMRTAEGRCGRGRIHTFQIKIANGSVNNGRGTVTVAGAFNFTGRGMDGRPAHFSGTMRGSTGSGTMYHPSCQGTYTMKRL